MHTAVTYPPLYIWTHTHTHTRTDRTTHTYLPTEYSMELIGRVNYTYLLWLHLLVSESVYSQPSVWCHICDAVTWHLASSLWCIWSN